MGRGLSEQQKTAIRRIGDELIAIRGRPWDRRRGVRCSTGTKTASGWASWARTLRRLEERGLVARMGWDGEKLTSAGWGLYRQLTGADVSEPLADQLRQEATGEHRSTIPGGSALDPMKILGLSWPFTAADAKAAYRRLVHRVHPDVGGSSEEFRRINEAYERVSGMV
jgi:DnaJ-like protein